MTNDTKLKDHLTQAVFSVCADATVVEIANEAALQVADSQFAGEFRDYVTADRRPQFSPILKTAASCVALIDFDRDSELALQTTDRLRQLFLNKIFIVGIGAKLDAGILLRAVRNGCTEFLTKPVSLAELTASLNRFHAARTVAPRAQSRIGRVIAIFGAKGGVGTTMLAVHLATHLVSQHGKKTLLIDHKQQLGHVALYLGLKETPYHFDELLRNANRLDSELLNGFVVRHKSGLDVIASPEAAAGIHQPKPDQLDLVMEFLRSEYDYVLIDSPAASQDFKTSIIDQFDEIYLVATPDVAALRDLAHLVQELSITDSAASKLRVVVNRSTATDSITPAQIEKVVRFPISIAVPNNYFELLRAINDGEPVPPNRRSEFNQSLARWANLITHESKGTQPPAARRGLFSFWR